MSGQIRHKALRICAACAFGFGIAVFSPGVWAATVWVVTFTIDDGPVYALSSDGKGTYKDYRIDMGGESDVNFCVEADATRSLFIKLNRKLDGDAGVQRCDTTPDHFYGTGVQRQYRLEIRNDSACAELGANNYLPMAMTWTQPCVITGGINPRIRMGSLFAKTARFPVDFLTTSPTESKATSISYEIQSTANATIVAGPGDLSNIRTVSYLGTARLVKFSPFGEKPKAVAEPFELPFQMTFVRHAK
jgi:hypothetical protein